jgi:hypothetical protein
VSEVDCRNARANGPSSLAYLQLTDRSIPIIAEWAHHIVANPA